MKRFVIDASVAVKWFIPEVHSASALRFLEEGIYLCAPDLLIPEFGNTLWKKTERREMTVAEAQEIVEAIDNMPVELFSTALLLRAAFEIATGLKRTVYDSLYLALAVSQKAALVTADRKLHSAVAASPLAAHVVWIEDEI
jgi:predicted nucleic acid-binding protein